MWKYRDYIVLRLWEWKVIAVVGGAENDWAAYRGPHIAEDDEIRDRGMKLFADEAAEMLASWKPGEVITINQRLQKVVAKYGGAAVGWRARSGRPGRSDEEIWRDGEDIPSSEVEEMLASFGELMYRR